MAKLSRIDKGETLHDPTEDLEARTELGREAMRQFRSALHHKKTHRVGDYNLHELLTECYNARDDRTLCDEQEFIEKYPEWTGMPISIVSFKVGILVALIRETLVDVASAPFIIDPTPNPEIPEEEEERILDELEAEVRLVSEHVITQQQVYIQQAAGAGIHSNVAVMQPDFPAFTSNQLMDMVKSAKVRLHQQVKDHATQQALLLQRDLYDKTAEGGYREAIMEFADDFATYPFACIHGPFPVIKSETKWVNNEFKEVQSVTWAFERVSPFDLFWTEDCSTTQSGTAIFVRKKVGYDYLFNCRKLARDDPKSGYFYETIDELIKMAEEGRIPRLWTEINAKNPENGNAFLWSRGDNCEILIRYGKFTGYDLEEMGFDNVDSDQYYETKTIICGGQVIYCQINNNPSQFKRPVFTASFESRNGDIAGVGLGQRLLSIHKAYRSLIQLMMYNVGLASEPVTEVEVNRILPYMPEEWVDDPTISPGMVIVADGDRMGNGSRAVKFTQIPTTTSECLNIAQFIMEQAHVISNIPAALHGQPVGSGANRTVRGLLTLQGNVLKPIQSALMNLDLGVIQPMVTLLYMLLVMYEDDFDYTGDCKVVAKGAASMVQREMEKQTAMENLQILAQAGQLGQQANPEIFARAYHRLLTIAGILEPGEELATPQLPMNSMPLGVAGATLPQGQLPGQPPMEQAPPQEPAPPVQ